MYLHLCLLFFSRRPPMRHQHVANAIHEPDKEEIGGGRKEADIQGPVHPGQLQLSGHTHCPQGLHIVSNRKYNYNTNTFICMVFLLCTIINQSLYVQYVQVCMYNMYNYVLQFVCTICTIIYSLHVQYVQLFTVCMYNMYNNMYNYTLEFICTMLGVLKLQI